MTQQKLNLIESQRPYFSFSKGLSAIHAIQTEITVYT